MVRIAVVGSANMDLVVTAPRLPQVGETVIGGTFATFPGGKGANQAVAAARLGASVAMVGRVGADAFGRALRDGLAAEGVDVRHLREDPQASTGVALITVDQAGRNTIVVASGANMRVSADDVEAARDVLAASQVVLLQLEVPVPVVLHAARLASEAGCRVILDPAPAPADPLPESLYRLLTVINPNEVEARALTGVDPADADGARRAADTLLARGCRAAVIKLGERGSYVAADGVRELAPAVPVQAVDTTAAGDAFAAALAVALAEGRDLRGAVRFATVAAAVSVTRAGAQPSMPRREEVLALAREAGVVL
ncbi:MAG: ribokinase [Armatimonadota bacterium]|nr:ribokinase [Armatimonadota bacterium]MDR7508374.1 ribokinase [Armatimonadota bacterium]MDR7516208.1 ribokinase [Armatimonadota bacterium]MDR7560239.1 ribokinase [Armatimonadota bacterium]MDR7583115.1 ribokinase [Armatimonadota bacterium]